VLNSRSEDPSVDDAPILHVDLDAFFASVEVLDDPTLRGKPVAVGGGGGRGVIASASYEARRFGVRSAMPSVVARRRCRDLIILPGRFDRYEAYSRQFHDIVRDLTPEFEPLGLDEVFANLSSLRRLNVRPMAASAELRRRIMSELGLLCGVGLGATSSSRNSPPRSPNRPSSTGSWSRAPGWSGSVPRSRRSGWRNCRCARSGASDRRPRRSCRNSDCAGCATWPRSTKRRSRRTWEWRWPRRSSPTPTARTSAKSRPIGY